MAGQERVMAKVETSLMLPCGSKMQMRGADGERSIETGCEKKKKEFGGAFVPQMVLISKLVLLSC